MNLRPGLVLMSSLALALTASAAAPAGETAQFRVTAAIDLAPRSQEEVADLRLPAVVFAETAEDLRDLRVIGPDGAVVPWLLERVTRPTTMVVRRDSAMRVATLTEDVENNRLELRFELEKDAAPPAGLTIDTPLRDFERTVTVVGRAAETDPWTPLTTNAVIFDAHRFMDLSEREVRFDANTCRQFRVTIGRVTDEATSTLREITRQLGNAAKGTETFTLERRPFRMDGIRWWHEEVVESGRTDVRTAYPVTITTTKTDAAKKQTRIRFTAGRAPLTRLAVETAGRNFSRAATLYAVPAETGTEPAPVVRGTLTRIQFRTLNRESLALEFPERRCTAWELVIENGDNPPIEVTGLRAEGTTYRLAFFCAPDRAYRLFFGGDPEAPAPAYDTAALRASMSRDYQPVSATLQATIANPDYRGASRAGWARLNSPWFMGGALVVMVLALGSVLFRSAKKIEDAE